MWGAAVPPPILLAAIITVAGCFLVLLLLVACSPSAARRITRLLVNLCEAIYAIRNQTPQSGYRHSSPRRRRTGRKRGAQ